MLFHVDFTRQSEDFTRQQSCWKGVDSDRDSERRAEVAAYHILIALLVDDYDYGELATDTSIEVETHPTRLLQLHDDHRIISLLAKVCLGL